MADPAPITTYLPEDSAAITALQDTIRNYKPAAAYTPEQEAQIMKGRGRNGFAEERQKDIDAGRQLINQRLQEAREAPNQIAALNRQLDDLKSVSAARYQKAKTSAELGQYQNSLTGEAMTGLKGLAPFIGAGLGAYEANALGNRMLGTSPVQASRSLRAGTLLPYAGLGALGLGTAEYLSKRSEDPRNTNFGSDVYQASADAAQKAGFANIAYAPFNAMRDVAGVDPFASKRTAAGGTEPELAPAAPPSRPIGKSGDPHTSAVNEIARRLDLPVEKAKKDTYAPIEPALRKADEEQIRRLAKDIHAYDPAALEGVAPEASLGKVRTAVVNFSRKVGSKGGTLAGLGLLGGLAAEAWPTRAEAAKPTDFPTRAELAAGLSRGWEAAKALPEQLIRGVPESFLGSTPGIQGGDLGLTPEEFQLSEDAKAAHIANLAAAKEARYREYQASIPPRDPGEVPEALRHYVEEGRRSGKAGKPSPATEEELSPAMVQKPPAEPYARGGKVSPPGHARAMNAKLSAMQHELQRALSVAVKRLESLEGKKGADRAAGKTHQEKEGLIEDIWGLHELAQKIVGGKLPVHHQISKKELIGLAREHASGATKAS